MTNILTQTWDMSSKKWLVWTGWVGFLTIIYFWVVAILLYFIFDREKPKTENYQIDRAYLKFVVISGNIILPILIYALFRIIGG